MELEENNRRMENLPTRMEHNFNKILEQKFNNLLLKMTPGKDKATEGDDRVMIDQTPILPTPLAHQRLQTEGQVHKTFKKDWRSSSSATNQSARNETYGSSHVRQFSRGKADYYNGEEIVECYCQESCKIVSS
nr:uncharacterized protein LOC113698584 [Coffea arabica]